MSKLIKSYRFIKVYRYIHIYQKKNFQTVHWMKRKANSISQTKKKICFTFLFRLVDLEQVAKVFSREKKKWNECRWPYLLQTNAKHKWYQFDKVGRTMPAYSTSIPSETHTFIIWIKFHWSSKGRSARKKVFCINCIHRSISSAFIAINFFIIMYDTNFYVLRIGYIIDITCFIFFFPFFFLP